MRRFGTNLNGTEENFEKHLLDRCRVSNGMFTYLEVGANECITTRAVYDILKEQKKNFYITAIDVPNWQSTMYENSKKYLPEEDYQIHNIPFFGPFDFKKKMHIVCCDADKYMSEYLKMKDIDFCFIDACHCYDHVKSNFLNVEEKIANGGYVLFHDVGILEQGMDRQHDDKYIDVRRAIADLGLWDNKRPGWKFIEEAQGTRNRGGNGNNLGIFRKE